MSSASADVLCTTCSSIDFNKYFSSEVDSITDAWGLVGPRSGAVKIGTVKELIYRSHTCAFCRIVVASICTKRLVYLTTPEEMLNRDQDNDIYVYSYCFLATSTRGKDVEKSYRIGVSKGPPGRFNNPRVHHAGDIQLSWEDAERIGGSRLGYARIMKAEKIDMSLPRLWMNTCWNAHGSFCDLSDLEHTSPPTQLLCVDVERGCIALLPPGARYCTLSYCWLTKRVLTLLKANYDEFIVPGSLTKRMAELPTVITDTIKFVNELGERWVWIDSLCIVQDDDIHKQHQIGQMDKVYGSSFLGIIAAKCMANDAIDNSGLARYNKDPKCRLQQVARVGEMMMTVPFESIDSLIEESRYDRRQWTYQEWILPRRLIFFTDTQVYFRCPCGTFCEDSVGEDVPPSTIFTPVSNLWNPTSPHIDEPTFEFGIPYLRSTPYGGDDAAQAAMRHYTTHIDTFTIREITYAEDTLNAFTGVQNILERNMKTRFWCGLPERYIDRTMLWVPWGVSARRMRQDPSLGTAFSSWSWAGWAGHMSYSYLPVTGIHREVIWYMANEYCDVVALATEGVPGDSPYADDGLQGGMAIEAAAALQDEKSLTLQFSEADPKSQAWKDGFLLLGWTTICQFHLTNQTVSWGSHETVFQYADNLKITNGAGIWVGCILIDRLWAVRNELEAKPIFEYIVLSRTERLDLGATMEPRFAEICDHGVFQRRDWCILNVMLVERHGDHFERVAVGVIHEDAWAAGEATRKLIKLR